MNIFFLLYHVIVFITFNIIYLLSMIILKKYWTGIEHEDDITKLNKYVNSIIDSFYFTVCTHTSLGYGDITPRSRYIRILTSVHMILVFISFSFLK